MPASLFTNIKVTVCETLKGLDPQLTYHNLFHTLDVLNQSERIARKEGISSKEELFLLKVAALYHDTGFLHTYANHEVKSCAIFLNDAGRFGFTEYQNEIVTGLIMATRIPQQPTTHLQKIICDADLDYLGRKDFFDVGETLRREFLHYGIVASNAEWEQVQLNFLHQHRFHTATSRVQRAPSQLEHYEVLVRNASAA